MEAAAPVFQGLRVERLAQPATCWAGPSHSRSCWRTPVECTTLRWDTRCYVVIFNKFRNRMWSREVRHMFIHVYVPLTVLFEVRGECGEHFILAGVWEVQEDPRHKIGWGMIELLSSLHGQSFYLFYDSWCYFFFFFFFNLVWTHFVVS